jgi:hypothetical protein
MDVVTTRQRSSWVLRFLALELVIVILYVPCEYVRSSRREAVAMFAAAGNPA